MGDTTVSPAGELRNWRMIGTHSIPIPERQLPASHAALDPRALKAAWDRAVRLDEFVAKAAQYKDLWHAMTARAQIPDELVIRAQSLPVTRRLLVLLEDWCGDAINTIPVLAALADTTSRLELRVLRRDENPALMDAHLSPTGARAIPVVMVLDDAYAERAWWGSRPTELQQWAMSPAGRAMEAADRYREVRRWYARDRGRSTMLHLLHLLEQTSDAAPRAA